MIIIKDNKEKATQIKSKQADIPMRRCDGTDGVSELERKIKNLRCPILCCCNRCPCRKTHNKNALVLAFKLIPDLVSCVLCLKVVCTGLN